MMNIQFQVKQMIKQAVQGIVLPVCYRMYRGGGVDPRLVIFADAHHDSRPAAMELLYRRLEESGRWRIVEHYLDYGSAGAGAVAKNSIRFMQLYASAGFVVIFDNFLPAASCRKRPETKVIQLWHACGCFKKFGYDAKDDIPAHYHGANVYRNADLVTVSGEAAVKPFASAMRLPVRCVRPVGVSRTDLYVREDWRESCRRRFYGKYPQAAGKKVVLWAPTFRGNAGVPELLPLDLKRLQSELGDSFLVIAKMHPHMRQTAGVFCCDIPTEELYPVVDVLIADYSSLIYEYLLFRKPLVLYVPDLEEYRWKRGFYMQIEEIPARLVRDEMKLAGAVREAASGVESEINKAGIEPGACLEKNTNLTTENECEITNPHMELDAFLEKYMGACDGHATERIEAWMEGVCGRSGQVPGGP